MRCWNIRQTKVGSVGTSGDQWGPVMKHTTGFTRDLKLHGGNREDVWKLAFKI